MLKNYLAGDLKLVEGDELAAIKTDIEPIERMLKALIKSLENKPLNLCLWGRSP